VIACTLSAAFSGHKAKKTVSVASTTDAKKSTAAHGEHIAVNSAPSLRKVTAKSAIPTIEGYLASDDQTTI
jgi:hypothetical protein